MPRAREMEEIDDIYDLAEQSLRGREATVFIRCVLDFHLDHAKPRTPQPTWLPSMASPKSKLWPSSAAPKRR
jgi:hypothetical protein